MGIPKLTTLSLALIFEFHDPEEMISEVGKSLLTI
jgi:hypothetical protein